MVVDQRLGVDLYVYLFSLLLPVERTSIVLDYAPHLCTTFIFTISIFKLYVRLQCCRGNPLESFWIQS